MVVVTALASWPVFSAHLADKALVIVARASSTTPSVRRPRTSRPSSARSTNQTRARTIGRPRVRASDTAVETMLYRNWLRGLLGSADSPTAQKYGDALYRRADLHLGGSSTTYGRTRARATRSSNARASEWMKVAEQIKTEDPEAYEYLTGAKGMERIGAGFIAHARLDHVRALRPHRIAARAARLPHLPVGGDRGARSSAPSALLRPASGGFRRLVNAVVAALFNIIIFGTGAAIYLFAVDLIMNTATLPGWLQVVLVWLCGVVGWLLLRPYRRITQLGGKDPAAAIASAGSWHRRFFRDVRDTAPLGAAIPRHGDGARTRRAADPADRTATGRTRPTRDAPGRHAFPHARRVRRRRRPSVGCPPRAGGGWREPEWPSPTPGYTVYRPSRSPVTTVDDFGTEARPCARRRAGTEIRTEVSATCDGR